MISGFQELIKRKKEGERRLSTTIRRTMDLNISIR